MNLSRRLPVITGLLFSLFTAGVPAFGEPPRAPETASSSPRSTDPDKPAKPEQQEPRKTEGLTRPGSGKLNPEESKPALLNPCRGNPPPRWCAE